MSEPRRKKRRKGRGLATFGILGALAAAIYWLLQFSGAGIGIPGLEGQSAREQTVERPEEKPEKPPEEKIEKPLRADADAAAEPAPPCELRVDAEGVHLEGRTVTAEEAVEACRPAGEAILTVTGDARYGTFEDTRDALEQSGVTVRVVR